MTPLRPADEALVWRLVAEAADRCADEAYELSEGAEFGTEAFEDRSTRAKALVHLAADLIPN